jgi:hypothetical protein
LNLDECKTGAQHRCDANQERTPANQNSSNWIIGMVFLLAVISFRFWLYTISSRFPPEQVRLTFLFGRSLTLMED